MSKTLQNNSRHFHRAYLIAESPAMGYPNYNASVITITQEEPSRLNRKNLLVSTPIFPLVNEGILSLPEINEGTIITFMMVPNIFPCFNDVATQFGSTNNLWFSIGLANLIVVEEKGSSIAKKLVSYLKENNNINAFEQWIIEDKKINPNYWFNQQESFSPVNIPSSDKLPLYLKFAVSEYTTSVNNFLRASQKFTPHYHLRHKKTIDASLYLINDLCYLSKDFTIEPSEALLASLQLSKEEAPEIIASGDADSMIEELINEKHGRLIQFNSSMSYVYSQAYSGTFPLFDHNAIVLRYSLLGIGSAIAALFELISQIESAMYFLPYENLDNTLYAKQFINNKEFLNLFTEASSHQIQAWTSDQVRNSFNNEPEIGSALPEDFFNRLSFFSGRLGFREYDFSATAAIQVLVEAYSLQWNIINYTHEIIHNHVRILLNELILQPYSSREEIYEKWAQDRMNNVEKLINNSWIDEIPENVSYKDYFICVILKFCINSEYSGSLSKESNQSLIMKLRANTKDCRLPTIDELRQLSINLNKDITEIFVHVFDYVYIYTRRKEIYLQSIWISWSTVTAVSNDLKQYIVRSLIIFGLDNTGSMHNRFEESKTQFLNFINALQSSNENAYIFTRIKKIFEKDTQDDLRYRFYNCLIIGDLVNTFFTGRLEKYLDNEDENRLDKSQDLTYGIETNSWEGNSIKSKVRFLLDQLLREVKHHSNANSDELKERKSAWLLLSLSSYE